MRGMEETYGMGAGASVRKGKTAKQVRRARKAIDAKKTSKVQPSSKTGNAEQIGGSTKMVARAMADKIGKPKATTKKNVTYFPGKTTVGAKSFVTRYEKPTPAAKARKAKPRQGY